VLCRTGETRGWSISSFVVYMWIWSLRVTSFPAIVTVFLWTGNSGGFSESVEASTSSSIGGGQACEGL